MRIYRDFQPWKLNQKLDSTEYMELSSTRSLLPHTAGVATHTSAGSTVSQADDDDNNLYLEQEPYEEPSSTVAPKLLLEKISSAMLL